MTPEEETELVDNLAFLSLVLTCFKSIIVACATLHFYYTVTHFDEEVEYIWSRKWTIGKIMYLLTRYLGALYLMYDWECCSFLHASGASCIRCSVVGVSTYAWNDAGIFLDSSDEPPTLKNFIPTCFYGELFAGLGPMIILAAEVILQMRVYALYGRDKRLLALFILLTISLFGFNILQLSELFLRVEQGVCDGLRGCFGKRSMSRRAFIPYIPLYRYACLLAVPISGIAWIVTAFTELLLFLLVVIRARKRLFKSREQAMTHDIHASMAKDSLSYFAVLFTVCLLGAVIEFVPERVSTDFTKHLFLQGNSYATIAITIMTILAPRLIISLREEVYGPSEITESQLTWNADISEHSSSDRGVGDLHGVDAGRRSSFGPERT